MEPEGKESVTNSSPLSGEECDQLERSNKKIEGPNGSASLLENSFDEKQSPKSSSPIR